MDRLAENNGLLDTNLSGIKRLGLENCVSGWDLLFRSLNQILQALLSNLFHVGGRLDNGT